MEREREIHRNPAGNQTWDIPITSWMLLLLTFLFCNYKHKSIQRSSLRTLIFLVITKINLQQQHKNELSVCNYAYNKLLYNVAQEISRNVTLNHGKSRWATVPLIHFSGENYTFSSSKQCLVTFLHGTATCEYCCN